MRLYFNGADVLSTTNALTVKGAGDFVFGNVKRSGYDLPCTGLVDNLKIWDYEKTDFSDRNYERSGCNDQIVKN
jgi:hypothetical protein